MNRGDVWWADYPSAGSRHPVLLLSWDAGYDFRSLVTIAQVTTQERGLDAEVRLDETDGMPRASVVNSDVIVTISRELLTELICTLSSTKMAAIERTIHLALGLQIPCPVQT